MDLKPLVLTDGANVGQIQFGDKLDARACAVVSRREFDELKRRHNLLVHYLIEQGIELPSKLLTDL